MALDLKQLGEVARRTDSTARVVGSDAATINSVTIDSRHVDGDALFACVRGANVDGHAFASEAVAAGAKALMVDAESSIPTDVPRLVVSDVRRSVGPVAAAVWGEPSAVLDVVGITGTNGKTSTVHMVAGILEAAGRRCETIGTLTGARTTPEAPDLQQQLAGFVAGGVDTVAMEVSSHALDQHRVDGTRFAVAAFTNLGPDHLDYHGDMETYFRAKARLFTPQLCAQAVVCTDDDHGRRLAAMVEVPVTTCSLDDVTDLHMDASGSRFRWQGLDMHVPLPGRFNVANALTAATVARVLGVPDEVIQTGLAGVAPVPGRFQSIEAGQPFSVIVDFAHTPDGLAEALAIATHISGSGRVVVVFGCGGERDSAKRPLMGQVAAASGADIVVTADNSRSEDTADIIGAIVRGVDAVPEASARLTIESDRRRAIGLALDAAAPGDLVLIAGRGHERVLTIGASSEPFSDAEVAAEELAVRGWAS